MASHIGEGCRADEGEGLVAVQARVGVDARQVDQVQPRLESGNNVAGRRTHATVHQRTERESIGISTPPHLIASGTSGQHILAIAAVERIRPGAAAQVVIATPAEQRVIANIAAQVVVAHAAVERIVAAEPAQRVVAEIAGQQVVQRVPRAVRGSAEKPQVLDFGHRSQVEIDGRFHAVGGPLTYQFNNRQMRRAGAVDVVAGPSRDGSLHLPADGVEQIGASRQRHVADQRAGVEQRVIAVTHGHRRGAANGAQIFDPRGAAHAHGDAGDQPGVEHNSVADGRIDRSAQTDNFAIVDDLRTGETEVHRVPDRGSQRQDGAGFGDRHDIVQAHGIDGWGDPGHHRTGDADAVVVVEDAYGRVGRKGGAGVADENTLLHKDEVVGIAGDDGIIGRCDIGGDDLRHGESPCVKSMARLTQYRNFVINGATGLIRPRRHQSPAEINLPPPPCR